MVGRLAHAELITFRIRHRVPDVRAFIALVQEPCAALFQCGADGVLIITVKTDVQVRAVLDRLGLGDLDEEDALPPRLSVLVRPADCLTGAPDADAVVLDEVALPRVLAEGFPNVLSGGLRLRVAIARALAL